MQAIVATFNGFNNGGARRGMQEDGINRKNNPHPRPSSCPPLPHHPPPSCTRRRRRRLTTSYSDISVT